MKKEDFKEKIIIDTPYFFGLSDRSSNTCVFNIDMIDEVDAKILREALDIACKRYPYLMLRRVKTFKRLYLEYNEKPVVIKQGDMIEELGCEAVNDHLLAFAYSGNRIRMFSAHGLFDGMGTLQFVRTLLYYYVSEKYNVDLRKDGIRLWGEKIDRSEYADPFNGFEYEDEPTILDEADERKEDEKVSVLNLCKDERVTPGKMQWKLLRVPQKDLIEYCKTHDGAPSVVLNLLLARAIDSLCPNRDKAIVGGVVTSIREQLDAVNTHHTVVTIVEMEYDEKVKKVDFSLQNTAYRSRLLLNTDRDVVRKRQAEQAGLFTKMEKIPGQGLKNLLINGMISKRETETFNVSYMGKAGFGDMEKYITRLACEVDSPLDGILIESVAANDYFYVTFEQNWEEPLFFEAFCKQFEEIGIGYELLEEREVKTAKLRF